MSGFNPPTHRITRRSTRILFRGTRAASWSAPSTSDDAGFAAAILVSNRGWLSSFLNNSVVVGDVIAGQCSEKQSVRGRCRKPSALSTPAACCALRRSLRSFLQCLRRRGSPREPRPFSPPGIAVDRLADTPACLIELNTTGCRGGDLNYGHFARVARSFPRSNTRLSFARTRGRGATRRAACWLCPRRNAEGEI